MKAYAYLRVSGRGQVKGDGFPRQLAAIKRHAEAHGLKIASVFKEEGVSGTTPFTQRPAFLKLMTALYSNGVKTVVIERLDRLARDLMVQESIIADFKQRGITLISVSEPDLLEDDPGRKLMRQMMGAFAEYEKTMIVLKLRGARERKKLERAVGGVPGKCEGALLYGELPGEAEIRDRIVKMRKSGMTLQKIADTLNAEGTRPRRAKRWYPSNVLTVVRRQS